MKKLNLVMLSMICSATFAQKVDLDRFSFSVSYQDLPRENVPVEKRTYGVRATTGGAIRSYVDDAGIYDKIHISGWKKVESDPTVGVEVNLEDFTFAGTESKSKTNETKDKDGKVTSSTTTYWVEARYQSRGVCRVKGPITPQAPTAKQLEEQKKKEEAKTNNRFLANVSATKAPEPTDGYNIGLGETFTYNTESQTSPSAASRIFQDKKESIYSEKLRSFVDGSINHVNRNLDDRYGFRAITTDDYLWILDSKDHPEFQTQQEAIQAVKELFKTMKAYESIATLESNLAPLIDYFQSLKTKYKGDDKREKKMRYSAYYNLAKIYYYLDRPEKAKAEAEALIKNDYDTKDGEQLAKLSDELAELFNKTKFTTRHNEPLK
jgi:hypothetical protein